jgi:hypothetical protein
MDNNTSPYAIDNDLSTRNISGTIFLGEVIHREDGPT